MIRLKRTFTINKKPLVQIRTVGSVEEDYVGSLGAALEIRVDGKSVWRDGFYSKQKTLVDVLGKELATKILKDHL